MYLFPGPPGKAGRSLVYVGRLHRAFPLIFPGSLGETGQSLRILFLLSPQVPLVKLDEVYFKLVDSMEKYIPPGAEPSLVDARTLVVKGPVQFSKGTSVCVCVCVCVWVWVCLC
jgi:hypothetical protein